MDNLREMGSKLSAFIKKLKELRDRVVTKNTTYVRPEPTSNYEVEVREKPGGDPQIVVFGALHIEYTTYVNEVPKPGEYVLGMYREKCYGGKAANQCIAANRLGAHCALIGKMGDDELGRQYHKYLRQMHINTDFLKAVAGNTTGISHIYVDDNSQKTIVVVSGANCKLTSKDVQCSKKLFKKARVLLCQLETDPKVVLAAIKQFKGVSILNAAPIPLKPISPELIAAPTIICVNAFEAAHLTDRENINTVYEAKAAANDLLEKGAQSVIITLGDKGAIHVSKKNQDRCIHCPAAPVSYVADTSGAGDAFLGSLAYHMAKYPNLSREYHIHAANICAAHSVEQRGTQPSFPGPELASFDLCRKKPVYYVVPDEDPSADDNESEEPGAQRSSVKPVTGTAEDQKKPSLSLRASGALQPKITFIESNTLETALAISGQNSIITTQNSIVATAELITSQNSIPAETIASQNTVASAADTKTSQNSVASAAEAITSQKSVPDQAISSQKSVPAQAISSQKSVPAQVISSQNSVPAEAISSQNSVPAEAISSLKSLPAESRTSQKSVTISDQKSVPAEAITSQKSVPAVSKTSQKYIAEKAIASQKYITEKAIASQKTITEKAITIKNGLLARTGYKKSEPLRAVEDSLESTRGAKASLESAGAAAVDSLESAKVTAISSPKSEEIRSASDESAKAIIDASAAATAKSIPDLNAAANLRSEDATERLSLDEGSLANPKISIGRTISDAQSLKSFVTESKKMCSNVKSGIKRMTTRAPSSAVAPVSARESSRASHQPGSSHDRQPRTAGSPQSKRKHPKRIKKQST